jgi:ribosome recycling factor
MLAACVALQEQPHERRLDRRRHAGQLVQEQKTRLRNARLDLRQQCPAQLAIDYER